jgi:polyhydroxybutyrate depolymerase
MRTKSGSAATVVVVLLVLTILVACGRERRNGDDDAAVTTTSADETVTSVAGRDASPVPTGTTTGTLDHDGATRTYRLHVPEGIEDHSVPLLVALHGGGGSGDQFASSSRWDAVADAEGFVVVYPNGSGGIPTWNAGQCCGAAARDDVDDVGFIGELIDELSATLPIDPSRVVLTGHSNGSTMSYRLACEMADRIVAIGVQSAPLTHQPCAPAEPVSLLHVHGAKDTNVPIDGGEGSGISGLNWPPVAQGVDTIAAADGCSPSPDVASADGTTHSTWTGCDDSEVEMIVVTDGAHGWMRPGGSGRRGDAEDVGFDSTATIWDFLERQLD